MMTMMIFGRVEWRCYPAFHSTRPSKELDNRRRITPIIETIILCGRQGIPLRGHRDSGPLTLESEGDINDGNFRALLRYRGKYDELFKRIMLLSDAILSTSAQLYKMK